VLQDGTASEYKPVPLNTSMKGWKSRWVYMENVEDGISTDIDSPAWPNPNWSARPSIDDMVQVEELLDILAHTDIDGVGCTLNFIGRRI